MDFETIKEKINCTAIKSCTIVVNKEDLGEFTITCTIRAYKIGKAYCDFGESNSLMPFSMLQNLGLGTPNKTTMRILMVESIKKLIDVLYDLLVKVDHFIFHKTLSLEIVN